QRTSMNVLLMNLAVADLIILLICLPTTVLTDVTKTFWFGLIPCKGIVFVQNTGVYVSVLTLTYISYERWKAVTDPLDISVANKRIVIPVIWVFAMILSTPEPFTLQIEPATFDKPNFTTTWGTQCRVSWSMEVEKTISTHPNSRILHPSSHHHFLSMLQYHNHSQSWPFSDRPSSDRISQEGRSNAGSGCICVRSLISTSPCSQYNHCLQ
ncbi:hypothetical protein PENTCL1PPCAC_22815, partial [Pristionchus entomophagus]